MRKSIVLIFILLGFSANLYSADNSWCPWNFKKNQGIQEFNRLEEINNNEIFDETSTPKISCIAAIRFYQILLSPNMPTHCNFYPSCSRYAQKSIKQRGMLEGCVMAADRLIRDHYGVAGYYFYNTSALHFRDTVEDNVYFNNFPEIF